MLDGFTKNWTCTYNGLIDLLMKTEYQDLLINQHFQFQCLFISAKFSVRRITSDTCWVNSEISFEVMNSTEKDERRVQANENEGVEDIENWWLAFCKISRKISEMKEKKSRCLI